MQTKLIIGAIALALLGGGLWYTNSPKSTLPPTIVSKVAEPPLVPPGPPAPGVAVTITDPSAVTATGTNEANEKKVSTIATYKSPAGKEEVGLTLLLDKNGVIMDAIVDTRSKNEISIKRQTAFKNALPAVVKGKKLADLGKLDRVGGSSLTTNAFNDALATLKSQA